MINLFIQKFVTREILFPSHTSVDVIEFALKFSHWNSIFENPVETLFPV